MKLNNLVFSLLLISSSLSVNANEVNDEMEVVSDSSNVDTEVTYTPEDSDNKNTMLQAIADKASFIILVSVIPAVLDLKEFSKKHSTVISLLTAAATYKLVKSKLQ